MSFSMVFRISYLSLYFLVLRFNIYKSINITYHINIFKDRNYIDKYDIISR